eukprot:CAMPEP_0206203260 /NCGR_PEP_ID=MMETSP0166-20121206/12725_1 /ASSEMBLY_ACC=CAM_ASM_000260 /TAXON_ID=95228 /ORGANISM="Vannella robusta, Strain DIVA3 518/3/11/1/6" /LENGTH=65 /DNA_ID=CAMNT_0053622467 /DNA_START=71 /DNA_END=265 /DNA_ORIENTATION=-
MAHLNINPETCFIDPSGSNISLGDFGNSISFNQGQQFSGIRGTSGYICPEMRDGKPYCPKNADIW